MIPLDSSEMMGVDQVSRIAIKRRKESSWNRESPCKATKSSSASPTSMVVGSPNDEAVSPRRSERLRRILPYVGGISASGRSGGSTRTWCRTRAHLALRDNVRKSRINELLEYQAVCKITNISRDISTKDDDAIVPEVSTENSDLNSWTPKEEEERLSTTNSDENHLHIQQQVINLTSVSTIPESSSHITNIPLLEDPRQWTRDDVHTWLRYCQFEHQLQDDIILDRFMMNGKALCIMKLDMFLNRVPRGGHLLYTEFQNRLRYVLSKNNNCQ